jgi:hypothetical protein
MTMTRQRPIMPLPDHPNRDLDPNGTENVPHGTPADEGYMLAPPRKQPRNAQPTQELIPILPEDHPDYQENTEILRAAVRRWESGKQK